MAEERGHITKAAKEALPGAKKLFSKKKQDSAKELSDDELRRRVNRLNMERQYKDLTKSETGKGWKIAESVLSIVGGLAAITVSGMTIYEKAKFDPPENAGVLATVKEMVDEFAWTLYAEADVQEG